MTMRLFSISNTHCLLNAGALLALWPHFRTPYFCRCRYVGMYYLSVWRTDWLTDWLADPMMIVLFFLLALGWRAGLGELTINPQFSFGWRVVFTITLLTARNVINYQNQSKRQRKFMFRHGSTALDSEYFIIIIGETNHGHSRGGVYQLPYHLVAGGGDSNWIGVQQVRGL